MDYLVLGLPRCRTSWLAFALGATHEYVSGGGDVSKLPEGTGCVEINPYLDYPSCKTVVIDRDYRDVADSLSYFSSTEPLAEGFIEKECLLAHKRLMEVAQERNALVIKFKDINNRMDDIFSFLGLPFNEKAVEGLMMYRIEPVSTNLDLILNHENFLCR